MADPKSEQIINDVSRFGGILGAADTDVQKAMDTLDDHTHDAVYLRLNAANDPLTGNLDFGNKEANNVDAINFNLTPSAAHGEGVMHWNADEGTLEVGMPGGDVIQQIGLELLIYVKNQGGGVNITNGQAVYIKGAAAPTTTVALASNDDIDKTMVIGLATEDIDVGEKGYITAVGLVRDLNTLNPNGESWVEGDKIYLGVNGNLTNVHPGSPTAAVIVVGTVSRKHATLGTILVSKTAFTIGNNYNGTLRQSVINKNTGNAAGASFTAVNDQGRRASLSIFGNSHATLPNIAGLYNEGYGAMAYVTDGNKGHKFYTDPTDSHDFSALDYLRLEITAAGDLVMPSNRRFYFGADQDAYIEYDGTNLNIVTDENDPSDFIVDCGTAKTLELAETVWDDQRVSASATIEAGAVPPPRKSFINNGVTGSGSALEFDGSNDEYIQIPSSNSLNFASAGGATAFSIGFIIEYDGSDAGHIITKTGNRWRVDILNNDRLRFRTASGINLVSTNTLNIGSKTCVVITVDASTTDVTAEMFFDGVLQGSDNDNGALTDVDDVIYINSRNGSAAMASFGLDELRIWNSVISAANIATFFNGGSYTENSIATEICGYHFNEGSGTDCDNFEGTAALDIDMTASGDDPAWITGFISGGSKGIFLHHFEPDVDQDLSFSTQFSHNRKLETDIVLHIHWAPKSTDTGDCRWGVEYAWQDIHGTYTTTTIVYAEDAGEGTTGKHQLINFSTIDGSGAAIVSSMIIGRVFREGTHANDTFTADAVLLELDFHYEIDTIGSRQEAAK